MFLKRWTIVWPFFHQYLLVQCHHSLAFKSIVYVSKHFLFRDEMSYLPNGSDVIGFFFKKHSQRPSWWPSDMKLWVLRWSPFLQFFQEYIDIENNWLLLLFCSWILNIEKVLTSLKKFSRNSICKKKKNFFFFGVAKYHPTAVLF